MQELTTWILLFGLILLGADWLSTVAFGGSKNWGAIELNPLARRLGIYGALLNGVLGIAAVTFFVDVILNYSMGFSNYGDAVNLFFWVFVGLYAYWVCRIIWNFKIGFNER